MSRHTPDRIDDATVVDWMIAGSYRHQVRLVAGALVLAALPHRRGPGTPTTVEELDELTGRQQAA